MLAGPSEPVDPKGGNVDLRRAAGDEVGHQPAGDRCGGQAGMAVPEGEVDVAESGRGTDDGQAVRPRRPMPHPFRSEEHTSELQSLMRISYAVFCLNKKNNTILNT